MTTKICEAVTIAIAAAMWNAGALAADLPKIGNATPVKRLFREWPEGVTDEEIATRYGAPSNIAVVGETVIWTFADLAETSTWTFYLVDGVVIDIRYSHQMGKTISLRETKEGATNG